VSGIVSNRSIGRYASPKYEKNLLLAGSLFLCSWRTYFDDIVKTDRQRNRNRHPPSFDVDNNEFLCTLCKTISNTVIPIIPQFHLLQPTLKTAAGQEAAEGDLGDSGQPPVPIELKFYEWLDALLIAIKYKKELKPADKSGSARKSEDMFTLKTNEAESSVPRFYTCPLDQVSTYHQNSTGTYKNFKLQGRLLY